MNGLEVTILDGGHGNLASVANAMHALGASAVVSRDPEAVRGASVLIFPGQGAAPRAMRSLKASGLDVAFAAAVRVGVPTLGICLGMQLALEDTVEGPTDCLGLVRGHSARFKPSNPRDKVPQIGWNSVRHANDPIFAGVEQGSYFYFVHSYYCEPEPAAAIGWTNYGIEYCSVLRRGRFWATQFHPEKSGRTGLKLLANFLELAKC
ncbi:MAG TPA: imidazole glycerol phosphate synthase subunit HisH [Chloroflexota bacterium]|nr:imidazole glycerol phosphate synthase subunit HisH [Chloroflexota bacterium]